MKPRFYGSAPRGCLFIGFLGSLYTLVPFFAVAALGGIIALLAGNVTPAEMRGFINGELATIASLLILLLGGFLIVNKYPSIELTEEGLNVEVFVGRFVWRFVPWSEVTGVFWHGPFRRGPMFGEYEVYEVFVHVCRLTIWHRLLSLLSGADWTPGIILLPDMDFRDELAAAIEDRLRAEGRLRKEQRKDQPYQ